MTNTSATSAPHLAEKPASNTPSSMTMLHHLTPYIYRYRIRVLLSALALLAAAASMLAMPTAFRLLIDRGFSATADLGTSMSTQDVNSVFLSLFALASVLAISTALRFYCVSWLGERISCDLRCDVYQQVLKQDRSFFESMRTGEVLSRLSSDTTLIQTLLGTSISLGLRNALLFLGSLIMMLYTDLTLASIILLLLVVGLLPIVIFGRRVRHLSRDSQDTLADSSALASETLNAMQLVQAYAREPLEASRYQHASDHAFSTAIRRNRSRALLTALAIVLIFGVIVFVLWLGAHAVMEGRLSAGQLTQFMMYAAIVGGSAGVMAEVFGDVQRAAGATDRLIELLQAEPIIVNHPQAVVEQTKDSSIGAEIQFEQVSFHYPSRPEQTSLNTLSFTISPGQTVALVGPSGAGKTTVLQLLLRFYDPQHGVVYMNNTALPNWDLTALRQHIGLVAQDSVIFSASAMENIRYGDLEASDEAVIAAAKAAQAHDFIEQLPQGYNTYLGERGMRLSGGQQQRLSIARALLKNPPLLLLDEATSALDAENEHKVQRALETAMQGRTTLVIAHRLATIVKADVILVMDNGRIVESGTHQSLIEQSGLYAELAAMQFSLTRDTAPPDTTL